MLPSFSLVATQASSKGISMLIYVKWTEKTIITFFWEIYFYFFCISVMDYAVADPNHEVLCVLD